MELRLSRNVDGRGPCRLVRRRAGLTVWETAGGRRVHVPAKGRGVSNDGPVVDLLAELGHIVDAYKHAPPTSARTAVCVVPSWWLDAEDPDEVQRVADEVARAHGFKNAEIRRLP